jgi:diguanylate cyclase (GGDEF)-like protein
VSTGDFRTRSLIDGEASRLEGGRLRWLAFSPKLERYFEIRTARLRQRRILIQGILCLVLFDAFSLIDHFLFHRSLAHSLAVRVGCATPPAIVALLRLRRGQRALETDTLMVCVSCIYAVAILYLYSGMGEVVSAYALFDLMLIIIFLNVGMRVRFASSLVGSAVLVLLGMEFILVDQWLSGPEKVESLGVLLTGTILSLIANYGTEHGERLNFLLRMRSAMQARELRLAQRHLLELANEDKLTRISNRRHFEEVYRSMWQQGLAAQSAVSVIMLDLDHFEKLNSLYGHSHGDFVLSRIAGLLRDSLRNRGDFLARYAGQEFVVVLADSSDEIGCGVADRLRRLIESSGQTVEPRDKFLVHGWPTISCGVATGTPAPGMDSIHLVELADQLLRQAKAAGRNRTFYASLPAAGSPAGEDQMPTLEMVPCVQDENG